MPAPGFLEPLRKLEARVVSDASHTYHTYILTMWVFVDLTYHTYILAMSNSLPDALDIYHTYHTYHTYVLRIYCMMLPDSQDASVTIWDLLPDAP